MENSYLQEWIDRCLKKKPGEDFALFYVPGNVSPWTAEMVNPVPAVMLGESSGKFHGHGATPEEAVKVLYAEIIHEENKDQ